jgi:transcription initiation factor TFIIB
MKQKSVLAGLPREHNGPHGPVITDNISGEMICGKCGTVLVERMEDSGQDQRGFSLEEYMGKSRTGSGSTLTIHDMGLSTVIGPKNKDATGNAISGYMKSTFNRLRLWDSRSKLDSTDRNLKTAFVILDSVKTKLNIPDTVAERAAYLYRKGQTKNLTRGRTIVSIMLASLYAACRETGTPKSLQDIADAGNVTIKLLSRNYRILAARLGLQLISYDSSEFVSRIAASLDMSEKAKRDALHILSQVKENGLSDGKNPISLASAALYLSSIINDNKINQKKLSEVSGISSVTIRNVTKSIRKSLEMGKYEQAETESR